MSVATLARRARADLSRLLFRVRLKGRSVADYFSGPDKIYIASADQFAGLERVAEAPALKPCRHFFSVIGGMGGLNVLARLDPLESITFFDINADAARVCRIHLALIGGARDRDDFVSLLYGRPFSSARYAAANQADYYALPSDPGLERRRRDVLGDALHADFQAIYPAYLDDPSRDIYDGVSCHVTRMPLFHDAPVDAVMTHPFYGRREMKWRRISNVNSLFMGKGWLASEERFAAVQRHLRGPVQIVTAPLHELQPPPASGLYASNVVDRDYPGLRPALNRFAWTIAYTPASRYRYAGYVPEESRRIPIARVYGAGMPNPHRSCCALLDSELRLEDQAFLEVVQPHPAHGLACGFRFYRGQQPVSVERFLALDEATPLPAILGVHILLGSGTSQALWRAVIEKAVRLQHAGRVRALFVFEHHKACFDWPEDDVAYDNLLDEARIDETLLALDAAWRKFGAASITGDATNVRNLCWILGAA
jgi:hypothetical protein